MMMNKLTIKTGLGLILACIFLAFGQSSCSSEKRQDAQIEKEIKQLRKQLPMEVAPNIHWVEVSFKGKVVSYVYELKDITDAVRESLRDGGSARKMMVEGLKNDPKTSEILNKGYIYRYTYRDTNGKEIYQCSISREDF